MRLLQEIVNLLSDKNGSLTDALLKTKVLMHRIGHKELVDWVNDELNGYVSRSPVPAYRVVPVRLAGNLRNIAWYYQNQNLPTGHLSEEERRYLTLNELRESIRVLEEYASKPTGQLIHRLAPEFFGKLSEAFDGGWVESAWTEMAPTQVMNVLVEVRSRLLDFALNLQGELGDVTEDKLKDVAKGIDAPGMFTSAVFGDNATFVFGNSNQTSITNAINRGDFAAMAKAFTEKGVSEADVAELKAAVDEDDPIAVSETKQFGPKTKGWMTTMSAKAIDGVWGIGIGAAGNLLADTIGRYYGIK